MSTNIESPEIPVSYDAIDRLTKDLINAARTLSPSEVRYVVDLYYQMQEYRKRAANQRRAAAEGEEEQVEPHALVGWALAQFVTLEGQIRRAMLAWAQGQPVGEWCLSIHGIGPVITAGLLAHLDIKKAPTVGHIWRFAGLDPSLVWKKGEKRPYNARLKVLCWKIGDSFVKTRNSDKDVYGAVYAERKALELQRNEAGDFAATAARSLVERKIQDRDLRATYEAGRLPAGRLDLRARRYAVKLYLAHLHHVMYEVEFGTPPPKPYVLTHLDHAHFIAPPNWPMV